MKAILLHHAGGDKYAYRNVTNWLLPEIESVAFELPGRSDRIRENLLHHIDDFVEDIFQQIKNELNEDYFFIGISMGGLLSWLLTDKFVKENLPLPKHIFLASRMPMEYYRTKPNVIGVTSVEFWNVILNYRGCPPQLVEHQELREFYEPILRADFEALQEHVHAFKELNKINVPASILYGNDDHQNFDVQQMKGWDKYFDDIEYKEFVGDHFFLYNKREATDFIKSKMLNTSLQSS